MSFSKQMESYMSANGLKPADVVKKTNIPYASLFKYLAGNRQPGADALTKIARGLNVSIDWLLLDIGEAKLDTKGTFTNLMESERKAEEAEFLDGLKLGDILLLGKKGAQKLPWKVLVYLGRVGSEGESTTNIFGNVYKAGKLGSTHDMIHDLAYLLQQGLILPAGKDSNRYRKANDFSSLPSTNISDIGQHTAQAMTMMADVINTEIMKDPKSGCIVTAQAWCDPNEADKVLARIIANTKKAISEPEEGSSQISLVLGVARTKE